MKIFKKYPKFRYGQRVTVVDPKHEHYGTEWRIWDVGEEPYFFFFTKVTVRLDGRDPENGFFTVFKVNPSQILHVFDPVSYYKGQPGDLKDDI